MFPSMSRSARFSIRALAVSGALSLAAAETVAQSTSFGSTSIGNRPSGSTGSSGGGGGSGGAASRPGASGAGTASSLGPGTNFSPAQVTATGAQGGSGSGTTIPSTFNPYRTTYSNPYALGATASTGAFGYSSGGNTSSGSAKAFGQPVYAITNTNASNLAAGVGLSNNSPAEFDNAHFRKVTPFATVLSADIPRPVRAPTQLAGNLRNVLDRSTQLASQQTIRLQVEGEIVVLTGSVATEKERRLAENLLRLTPGVVDVVNELQVR